MPIYRIKAPDGNVYRLRGPEDATTQELETALEAQQPYAFQTTEQLKEAKSAPFSASNLGLESLAAGAGGIKALTDVFGTGNAASKALEGFQQKQISSVSPERMEEMRRREEIKGRAKTTGEEIAAYAGGFAEAPLTTTVGALTSSLPIIAGGLIPGGAAASLAARGAQAAPLLTRAQAVQTGIGGLMGLGGQKGQEYQAVRDALIEKGLREEEADKVAQQVSSYGLESLPRQLAAAVAGALEGRFGAESVVSNALTKRNLGRGVGAVPTNTQAALSSIVGETAPEALQAGVSTVGTNMALNQAGVPTDLTKGLAGSVAHDALVGATLGLAVSPAQKANLIREYEKGRADEDLQKRQELEKEIADNNAKFEKERAAKLKANEELGELLGVNNKILALPAPAKEARTEEDVLQNPLGRVTREELAPEVTKYIDTYRKDNGLPRLKDFSIEDVRDAMTQVNPEGERAALDSIITAKTSYTGNESYTPEDVFNAAARANVATETKGFRDFLARTTGESDLNKMSPPQLYAAFSALDRMGDRTNEKQTVLPEGSNATRYTQKQYDNAVKFVNASLDEAGGPLGRDQIVKDIKDSTNLETDRDAETILNNAIKNGDLSQTEERVYRTVDPETGAVKFTYRDKAQAEKAAAKQGLNVQDTTLRQIATKESPTVPRQVLTAGYELEEQTLEAGQAPAEIGIFPEGKGKKLATVPTMEDVQGKIERLTGLRQQEAAKTLKDIEKYEQTIASAEKSLEGKEARGEEGSEGYKKAQAQLARMKDILGRRMTALYDRIEEMNLPLKAKASGTKQVTRKVVNVKKDGKVVGTYRDRATAIESILLTMSDAELEELSVKGGATGDRAAKALEERKTPGQRIKGTKEGLEKAGVETTEFKQKLKALEDKLVPMLTKFGLKDVALKVVRAIENGKADGSFSGIDKLIQIALDARKPIETMRHEALHALKNLGFFTLQQWKVLENKAEAEWVNKYLKGQMVEVAGQKMSRYDAYSKGVQDADGNYILKPLSKEALLEEAIADAFADYAAGTKPPAGMIQALFNKLNEFFKALRSALTGANFESAEEIFDKIEAGELEAVTEIKAVGTQGKQSIANAWQATPEDVEKADKYSIKNDILPYVSAGRLELPLETPKFSLKTADKYGIDPTFNIPLNKDGTVTVYYHTTKDGAQTINNNKTIKTSGKRIYLTNESSGALVMENKGNFDQDTDGSVVMMKLPPSMLHLDEEYGSGRKDFFVPVAQGEFFDQKMRMSAIQVSKNKPILEGKPFSYSEYSKRVTAAIEEFNDLPAKEQKARLKEIKTLMKQQHNIGTLLSENGKLEKTREVGLKDQEQDVASMGLGLAAAQRITDKLSTCPNSAICVDLCLGDTAGGNKQYGGVAAKDVNGVEKSAFRAGPRMSQYLKTEGLIINPEAFAILLNNEINSFVKWAKKNDYAPSIRLNVTSDIKPEFWAGLMAAHPYVVFYDYTKLNGDAIAPNHHLTYSSTGFGQIVDGKKVTHKTNNWPAMKGRLDRGFNVAMAFTSKSALPDVVVDEATGKSYKVWDGDNYDARYLDPKQEDGVGMIVGLRNKASTMKEATSTVDTDGFFANYDPKTDGKSVVVPDQAKFKSSVIPITPAKLSLRTHFPDAAAAKEAVKDVTAPETTEFKQFFRSSQFVNKDGDPRIMYHGTSRYIDEFTPKQADAIFITDNVDFAQTFAENSADFIRKEVYAALTKAEKVDFFQRITDNLVSEDKITASEAKKAMSDVKKKAPEYNSFFGGDIEEAVLRELLALSPTQPNIMPLWVSAQNVFDYENPKHVQHVIDWMSQNVDLGHMDFPEKWLAGRKGSISRGLWNIIETPSVQKAIRALGFDGFSMKEGKDKNYGVYSPVQVKSATGNIGTFSLDNKGIKYSLRSAADKFETQSIKDAAVPKYKSKDKLVEMRISDFLDLAEQGFDQSKQDNADRIILSDEKLMKIPEMFVWGSGNTYDVMGHEGRHRARALLNAGYDTMPVLLKNTPIRWSEQSDPESLDYKKDWPKTLKAEKGALKGWFSIDFPVTREESAKSYSPEIKFSLKTMPQVGKGINDRVNETTTTREEKGFFARMSEAIGPRSADYFRQKALNRYNQLSNIDRLAAEAMGGVKLLADASAEAMALMSDLSSGVTASVLGHGDRHGGIPVLRNGATTVDRNTKGLIAILEPIARYNDPKVYQYLQFVMAEKRGSRLNAEGREQVFTAADKAYAQELKTKFPEFQTFMEEYNKFNDGLVKYLVDTGVLTKEKGAEFKKYADYVPFYRQMEGETTIGPNVFRSISGVKGPKALKGGEAPLADFLETMVRNTQAAINMGMKNTASQVAAKNAVTAKVAERVVAESGKDLIMTGPEYFQVLEGGKQVSYRTYDALLIDALSSLHMPDLPFMGILSAPSNWLRNLVTKDPAFMMANLLRDSLSAYVTSGEKLTPVVSTVSGFYEALRGKSKGFDALMDAGVIGGYEFSANVESSGRSLQQDLEKKFGQTKGLKAKALRSVESLWDGLEKGTTASDAATRAKVYEQVLAETGNEAEALYRSLEIMNFNRKGNSPLIRILTASVPFLNARMQGLDVFYRAGIAPTWRQIKYGIKPTEAQKNIQRAFFTRGMMLMSLSLMYYAMVHDDEEWKSQEQETRDNNWIVPSAGLKIPIPFEVGVLFKVIPERIAALAFGNDTGEEFLKSMERNLWNTLGFNPIPQTFKPIVEVVTNYNFFTGRKIIGLGMEDVESEYQVAPNTSRVSESIAKSIGASPIKVDHIIKGYTGSIGMYAIDIIDSILSLNSDETKAAKRFEQMPIIKRFAADPEARGNVTAYYELKDASDKFARTMNLLERTGDPKEFAKYVNDNKGLFATRDYVLDLEKSMKELREMKAMVQSSPLNPTDKRDTLIEIGRMENNLTVNIKDVRKLISSIQ